MRYTPIRELGAGGMAVVTLARDDAGALVVLKRTISRKPSDEKRLRDEGRIGRRLRHPAVVQTLDGFEEPDGRPVIVLEYVAGLSMAALRAYGPMSPGLCCVVGYHVASALAAIHEAKDDKGNPLNILHRDVTPANILVSLDGQPKLIDLGIARADDSIATKTATGEVRGTLRYLAPELFNDQKQSTKSDLWALGIVLLEAALGKPLYRGSTHEILTQILRGPPLAGDTLSRVHPMLADAVRPLLQPNPAERDASASEAAQRFLKAAEVLGADRDALARHVQVACQSAPETVPEDKKTEDEESWSSLFDAREALTVVAGTPGTALPIILRSNKHRRRGILVGAALAAALLSIALAMLNWDWEERPAEELKLGKLNPTSSPPSTESFNRTVLLPMGSVWKYNDGPPATTLDFIKPEHDDSGWKSGRARLGYGGDGEVTVLEFGDDPKNKRPSVLFRTTFDVDDPSLFEAIEFRIIVDDGVALRINGVSVLSDGLPPNAMPWHYATNFINDDGGRKTEKVPMVFIEKARWLKAGKNVVAVDVHQFAPDSSDLAFDMEIIGLSRK